MRLGALRIAIVYIALGTLWITLSDKLLFLLKGELSNKTFELAGNTKGIFFVIVTGVLLWKLIKRDDNRLIESEKQYRSMYEGSPLPMWIYDLETLKFSSVNQTTIDTYGYSKNDFLQMSISDIRPTGHVPNVDEEVKNVSKTVKQSGPWLHKKADGSQIYVNIAAQKITFNNKPHVIVMAQDVNERVAFEQRLKKLNNDLREKTSKLSETQQIAKVAGWELFLENKYMVWSDEMHMITAIGPLQNNNMFDLYLQHIHPEDKEKVSDKLELLASTGEETDFTHRMILENGNTHYVRQVAKMEYYWTCPIKLLDLHRI
ncbi:PAS domain-containing protein [Mucilaginibacter terrae]|uniref:PAS domain-containing protein n=1 Tax=Mucilaginibacter terrae TaxID=1955052 RepID=UPI00363C610C